MVRSERYSGRFLLRVGPELHARLAADAKRLGRSLNEQCVRLLSAEVTADRLGAAGLDRRFIDSVVAAFPSRPIAVVLFGSFARREDTADSDIDLLIVFETGTRIERSLYRHFDERADVFGLAREPSPHLVALPATGREAGSLWLEAAQDGVVLFEEGNRTSVLLRRLRESVARGELRRGIVHGHPYWIREEEVAP